MGNLQPMTKPDKKCRKWRLEVSCGSDNNGKRIRHTKVVEGTKTEARKALAEFETYWGVGKIEDQSFAGYCEAYIKSKEGHIADSSLYNLRSRVRVLTRLFGEQVKLSQMTPELIDAKMLELLNGGGTSGRKAKPSYVGGIKQCLASILLHALKHNALAKDPIPATQYYSARAPHRDVPLTTELNKIMANIDVRDYRQMAVLLTISLGLRRQECCGLLFSDIDYENNRILVRHTIRWHNGVNEFVEMTKTDAGRREIPMPSFMPALLEERHRELKMDVEFALRSGQIEKEPELWFVCGNKLGEHPSTTSITKWWCNHRAGLGFTCAFHDLRHCFITAMANANPPINPAVAAKIAGHGDVGTTLNVYTHPQWDQQVEAISAVETIFELSEALTIDTSPNVSASVSPWA